jgi:phosphohistidine phosphatase
MKIYVLRHGIAEDQRAGKSDAARKLTAEGKQKLLRVLELARGTGVSVSLILSSPLVRAVETAELAAELLRYQGRIVQTEALLPESTPQSVWEQVRARKGESAVLLAGHEPLLSAVVAHLLGAPSLRVDFKKGAMVRVDCDRLSGEPDGVLKWMLTPGLAG